jgi:hypothetical protein
MAKEHPQAWDNIKNCVYSGNLPAAKKAVGDLCKWSPDEVDLQIIQFFLSCLIDALAVQDLEKRIGHDIRKNILDIVQNFDLRIEAVSDNDDEDDDRGTLVAPQPGKKPQIALNQIYFDKIKKLQQQIDAERQAQQSSLNTDEIISHSADAVDEQSDAEESTDPDTQDEELFIENLKVRLRLFQTHLDKIFDQTAANPFGITPTEIHGVADLDNLRNLLADTEQTLASQISHTQQTLQNLESTQRTLLDIKALIKNHFEQTQRLSCTPIDSPENRHGLSH